MRRALTLGELAAPGKSSLATGPFGSAVSSKNFRPSGVPMLRGSNLSEDVGTRLDESALVFLDPELADKFSRSTARSGDLIFTCWGTIGQIGLIDDHARFDRYIVSNKQMKMTPDPSQADSRFLYYYLSQPQWVDYVQAQAIGSSVPGFNLGQLRALQVEVPDLAEQRAVAEVLGALDDKIAANDKTRSLLRRLATAEFRAMIEGPTNGAVLGDVLTLEYGKALPASKREGGDVPVYGSGGEVGRHSVALVDRPGVVVGRKGTAGAVHWVGGPHFPIDTTFYVRPIRPDVPLTFCYFTLRRLGLTEMNSDSAVPGLNRNEAHAQPIRLPNAEARRAFDALVLPLFECVDQWGDENGRLAAMRDALLPQLMSGKIRVKDAEDVVSEAM